MPEDGRAAALDYPQKRQDDQNHYGQSDYIQEVVHIHSSADTYGSRQSSIAVRLARLHLLGEKQVSCRYAYVPYVAPACSRLGQGFAHQTWLICGLLLALSSGSL